MKIRSSVLGDIGLLVYFSLGFSWGRGSRVNFNFVSIDDPFLRFWRYSVVGTFSLVTVFLDGGRRQGEF